MRRSADALSESDTSTKMVPRSSTAGWSYVYFWTSKPPRKPGCQSARPEVPVEKRVDHRFDLRPAEDVPSARNGVERNLHTRLPQRFMQQLALVERHDRIL